jgi:hypothetical protein
MTTKHDIRSHAIGTMSAAVLLMAINASAVPYYYTDRTSADPSGGTAVGTNTPGSGPAVTVNFDALNPDGTHDSFLGVVGSWLWNPVFAYQSFQIDNTSTFNSFQLVAGDVT